MIKITIIGRVRDGLPLAQGPRYVNDENDSLYACYRQQGEFILKEISRGAFLHPRMTVRIDNHCFYYIIENGICFMALCESSYPQKLVYFYLQDLAKEFEKFDKSIVQKLKTPYSFVGFGTVIGNLRKQYTDKRTQTNLSKLNAKYTLDNDVKTDDFSQLKKRRKRFHARSITHLYVIQIITEFR